MAMVVNHNLPATNAYRHLNMNNAKMSKSIEKLSSGLAINRAGDDAAGLAVSEKMRAQISGLNQAVKNAQDGISMVQTYEGALTETDSILQRMRTLAAQSANGTYQDDVDREAIQLEFDQLNDELNQIADTDFNGVVVLNGGQMADGLKAVNGSFDYSNSTRDAKQLSTADINAIDTQGLDNGSGTTSNATKLWTDFGFNRADTNPDNNGPDSVDVTFKYNSADGTWKAISATGGASIDKIKTNTAKGNNGGFQIGSATTVAAPTADSNLANVVLDGSQLVNGDTVTVRFNNPSAKNSAIENIGVSSADYSNLTVGTAATVVNGASDLTVKIENTKVETTNTPTYTTKMTEDIDELFNRLNGAVVKVDYTDTTDATKGLEKGAISITLTDENGNTTTLDKSQNGGKPVYQIGDTKFLFDFSTDGKLSIGVDGATTGTVDTNYGNLVSLTAAANTAGTTGSRGTVTYNIAVDKSIYTGANTPSAEIVAPESVVSKSNSNNASTATLTYTDNITLQVGARTKDSVNFTFSYKSEGLGDLKADLDCSARGLGTDKLSLSTQKSANAAIDKIDNAINKVSMVRGSFGAMQNRLEHKVDNLNVASENLTAAESAIRDTDMAKEMMNFTKSQILSQASQAMLAQANQLPQGVLQLLQ